MLEAIHLLIMLRTNKTNKDSELIAFGKEETMVKGCFYNEKTQKTATVLISKYFKKMNINGELVKKASDYIGFVDVVSFGTEDVNAVSGAPSERRRMLDMFCCQFDLEYMNVLKKYKMLLKERNLFLKSADPNNKKDSILLDVIDDKIVEQGKVLVKKRQNLCSRINAEMENIYSFLSNEDAKCFLEYKKNVDENEYLDVLKRNKKQDMSALTTTVGPHRDDFLFLLDNYELGKFGSQGQKKTAILCFKMACVRLIKKEKNRNPIVLLDDVFGELDAKRQNNLLKIIDKETQTFITTPSLIELDETLIQSSNLILLKKEEL